MTWWIKNDGYSFLIRLDLMKGVPIKSRSWFWDKGGAKFSIKETVLSSSPAASYVEEVSCRQ